MDYPEISVKKSKEWQCESLPFFCKYLSANHSIKYVGKKTLKTQKAVAHAQRALQLFGFWV